MEVNLERKNEPYTKQKFPSGIITTNNYLIPSALMERMQVIHFKGNKLMFELHPFTLTKEHIYLILVMLNLIPAESHVIELISETFIKWQREHDTGCKCLQKYIPMWQIKEKDMSEEQAIALLQSMNCDADTNE